MVSAADSGGVLPVVEGTVADLAQELAVVAERSDMAPVDVLWVDPEVVGAELGQTLQHLIDLALPGDECVERLAPTNARFRHVIQSFFAKRTLGSTMVGRVARLLRGNPPNRLAEAARATAEWTSGAALLST
jgi:hypothetical protein